MVVDNRVGVTFVSAAFCFMIVMGVARIWHAETKAATIRAEAAPTVRIVENAAADTQDSWCVRTLFTGLKKA